MKYFVENKMSKYKKLMDFDKKKKVTKKESKPKSNKIIESINKEFGYKKKLNEENYIAMDFAEDISAGLKSMYFDLKTFSKKVKDRNTTKEAVNTFKWLKKFEKEFNKFLKKQL
jgi:hypothetical protein